MTRHRRPDAQPLARPVPAPRRVVPLAVRLLLLLTLCLAALPFTAHVARAAAFAVTVTTTTDSNSGACAATGVGPCSLREAILFANSKSNGDTTAITLPAGTYKLTLLGAGENNGTTGDLDIRRSVTLNGVGAATTIIDGQGNLPGGDRVFEILDNSVVAMNGVTIRNGKVVDHGGGIRGLTLSLLTLTDCVVKENSARVAGGGVSTQGPLTLINTTVSDNTVTGIDIADSGSVYGGGVFARSILTLTGSKVLTNQALGTAGGFAYGGGIYTDGGAVLTASIVQDNTATGGPVAPGRAHGGGIYHKNSPLTLTDSSVIANKAIGGAGGGLAFGGGIAGLNGLLSITGGGVNANLASGTSGHFAQGGGVYHDGGPLLILASTLNGNAASGTFANGGALFTKSANSASLIGTMIGGNTATGFGSGAEGGGILSENALAITGSTLNGNTATDNTAYGGGITHRHGHLTITNSTFSGNGATTGGGALYLNAGSETASLMNVTIADNSGGVAQSAGILFLQNTIIANSMAGKPNCAGSLTDGGHNLDSGATCGFSAAVGGLSNTNPQLSAFDFHGADTFKTYLLLPNSPAIDQAPSCPDYDQLGTARPQGNGCDLGAVEFAPALPTVTSIAPATGPAAGGTTVTIGGSGFLQGATATIGGQTCLSPVVGSSSTITCVTPAGPAGPANVAVSNPGLPPGSTPGVLVGGFTYQPIPTFAVTLSKTGNGSVGGNPGSYPAGSTATFIATPDAGNLFLGWTVDGIFVGFNPTLALPMTRDRAVVAAFAPLPTFCDVTPETTGYEAIINLAARGIVKGQDGCFNPAEPLLRAQSAAMLARTFGWDAEDHGNAFPDQGEVDADLWRNVGTLAFYNVAKGYPDGTYDPTGTVLHAQAVSFATRALIIKGYWQLQADDPSLYTNIPADSGHRLDLATYVHYAYAVPGTIDGPWDGPGGWDQPASRGYFARVLWQAYSSYFSTNHVP